MTKFFMTKRSTKDKEQALKTKTMEQLYREGKVGEFDHLADNKREMRENELRQIERERQRQKAEKSS